MSMGHRWAAYGTARAPNGCILQPSIEHALTAGTALQEAAHPPHLWVKADWCQESLFLADSMEILHSIGDLLQHREDCEPRSTRFNIDRSFLGLDRIRCALHVTTCCVTLLIVGRGRCPSFQFTVSTCSIPLPLSLKLDCTQWKPFCGRKLPLKHTATFSSSSSLVPL